MAKLMVGARRLQQQAGGVEMGDNQIKVEKEEGEERETHLGKEVVWKRGHCH